MQITPKAPPIKSPCADYRMITNFAFTPTDDRSIYGEAQQAQTNPSTTNPAQVVYVYFVVRGPTILLFSLKFKWFCGCLYASVCVCALLACLQYRRTLLILLLLLKSLLHVVAPFRVRKCEWVTCIQMYGYSSMRDSSQLYPSPSNAHKSTRAAMNWILASSAAVLHFLSISLSPPLGNIICNFLSWSSLEIYLCGFVVFLVHYYHRVERDLDCAGYKMRQSRNTNTKMMMTKSSQQTTR